MIIAKTIISNLSFNSPLSHIMYIALSNVLNHRVIYAGLIFFFQFIKGKILFLVVGISNH